jgi:hypothetical protein
MMQGRTPPLQLRKTYSTTHRSTRSTADQSLSAAKEGRALLAQHCTLRQEFEGTPGVHMEWVPTQQSGCASSWAGQQEAAGALPRPTVQEWGAHRGAGNRMDKPWPHVSSVMNSVHDQRGNFSVTNSQQLTIARTRQLDTAVLLSVSTH